MRRRELLLHRFALALHPIAMIRLPPVRKVRVNGKLTEFKFTEKERMKQLLFGNIGWFIVTSVGLIVAIILASTCPNAALWTLKFSHEIFGTYKLSETAIVSEDGPTQAFKVLFSILLIFGFTSLGLIYWKLSNAKDTLDDDEEGDGDNDEDQEETEESREMTSSCLKKEQNKTGEETKKLHLMCAIWIFHYKTFNKCLSKLLT